MTSTWTQLHSWIVTNKLIGTFISGHHHFQSSWHQVQTYIQVYGLIMSTDLTGRHSVLQNANAMGGIPFWKMPLHRTGQYDNFPQHSQEAPLYIPASIIMLNNVPWQQGLHFPTLSSALKFTGCNAVLGYPRLVRTFLLKKMCFKELKQRRTNCI